MKKKSYEIEYMSINPKPKHQEFLVKPFPAPLSDKLEQPKRLWKRILGLFNKPKKKLSYKEIQENISNMSNACKNTIDRNCFNIITGNKLEQPKQIIFPDWFAYLLLAVAIIFILLNIK